MLIIFFSKIKTFLHGCTLACRKDRKLINVAYGILESNQADQAVLKNYKNGTFLQKETR